MAINLRIPPVLLRKVRITVVALLTALIFFSNQYYHSKEGRVSALSQQELLIKLSSGNHIIFFRHTKRDSSTLPIIPVELDNAEICQVGTKLTTEGRQDAVAIGKALHLKSIPFKTVWVSPTCRTKEMAQLAFGDFISTRTVAHSRMLEESERAYRDAELRRLISTRPDTGTNTIILAHEGVLERLGQGPALREGDAAILEPQGNGKFKYLGNISKITWLGLAETKIKSNFVPAQIEPR